MVLAAITKKSVFPGKTGMIREMESVPAEETRCETRAGSCLRNAPRIGHITEELRRLERRKAEEGPAQQT